MRHLVQTTLAIGLLVTPDIGVAQTPERISVTGSPTARLSLVRYASLGEGAEEYGGVSDNALVRSSGGEFYHANVYVEGHILRFDSTGGFLGVQGRRGSGPGEYRTIRHLAIHADTLFVFDVRNQRIAVIDAQWEQVRTIPFAAFVTEGQLLPSGDLIVNAQIRSRTASGYHFHQVTPDGKVVRSFGSAVPSTNSSRAALRPVQMRGDSIVTIQRHSYRVEIWRDFSLLTTFERNPGLFPAYGTPQPLTRERPPQPYMVDVHLDDDGRVWTLAAVPDTNWRTGLAENGTISDHAALWDSVVEVFDVKTGALLVSNRTGANLLGFLGNGDIYGRRTDRFGAEYFDVYRAQVLR